MLLLDGELSPWELRAIRRASWRSALIVFVAVDGRPIGALLLADELRSDTPRAIRLRKIHLKESERKRQARQAQ